MKTYDQLKIVVVGSGSIGQRHIRNLLTLGVKDITICDSNEERLSKVSQELNVKGVSDFTKDKFDIAFICTPHVSHLSIATEFAKAGTDIFIEKPLSNSYEGVDSLIKLIEEKKLITMVGCNFRFHPGMKIIKEKIENGEIKKIISIRAEFGQFLPDWHPWADYRTESRANKSMGGGVILDRIHEIDYLYWLFGKPQKVASLYGQKSNLEIDTEDVAEILMSYPAGPVISVHLDYIQRKYYCAMKIVTEEGNYLWNFHLNNLIFETKDREEITWENKEYDKNDMYVEEIKYFIDKVLTRDQTMCDVSKGAQVLKIALDITENNIEV